MNLRDQILMVHSKENTNKVVQWVGKSQKRFDELFHLFLFDEFRVVQRAAWAISNCVIEHPEFINPHWKLFLENIGKQGIHDAVKRNSLRLMQHTDIPKKYQGVVMNFCFQFLSSPKEAIAIRAFALTVLTNLAYHYPEIIPEIRLLINNTIIQQSPGFKVCALRFEKAFAK